MKNIIDSPLSVFEGVKMKSRLQLEGGITRISLENAYLLFKRHGVPGTVMLIGPDDDYSNQGVLAVWRGYQHLFTGFSWGYCGEGPRGLNTFLEACNYPVPRNRDARTIVTTSLVTTVFEKR